MRKFILSGLAGLTLCAVLPSAASAQTEAEAEAKAVASLFYLKRETPAQMTWFEFTNLSGLLRTIVSFDGRPESLQSRESIAAATDLIVKIGAAREPDFARVHAASLRRIFSADEIAAIAAATRDERSVVYFECVRMGFTDMKSSPTCAPAAEIAPKMTSDAALKKFQGYLTNGETLDPKLAEDVFNAACATLPDFVRALKEKFPKAEVDATKHSLIVAGRRRACASRG